MTAAGFSKASWARVESPGTGGSGTVDFDKLELKSILFSDGTLGKLAVLILGGTIGFCSNVATLSCSAVGAAGICKERVEDLTDSGIKWAIGLNKRTRWLSSEGGFSFSQYAIPSRVDFCILCHRRVSA